MAGGTTRRMLPSATLRAFGPYAMLAAAIFLAAAVVGAAVEVGNGSTHLVPVREGGSEVVARSVGYFAAHNLPIALATAGGFLALGVPTVYLLGFNGLLVGSALWGAATALGPATALALVLPHGVLELPALWLAGGIAFRWVHAAWRVPRGDTSGPGAEALLARTLVAVGLVVGLLVVAAVVEARVTVPLARALVGA